MSYCRGRGIYVVVVVLVVAVIVVFVVRYELRRGTSISSSTQEQADSPETAPQDQEVSGRHVAHVGPIILSQQAVNTKPHQHISAKQRRYV